MVYLNIGQPEIASTLSSLQILCLSLVNLATIEDNSNDTDIV